MGRFWTAYEWVVEMEMYIDGSLGSSSARGKTRESIAYPGQKLFTHDYIFGETRRFMSHTTLKLSFQSFLMSFGRRARSLILAASTLPHSSRQRGRSLSHRRKPCIDLPSR